MISTENHMSKASFKAGMNPEVPWKTFAVYQTTGGAQLSDLDVVLISSDAEIAVQESAFMLPDEFSGDEEAYPTWNISAYLPNVTGIGRSAFKWRKFDCAAISARDCAVGEYALAHTTFNAPYDPLSAKYSGAMGDEDVGDVY